MFKFDKKWGSSVKKLACVLYGSPNKSGHTRMLLDTFLGYLPDYDVKIIDSYHENVHACIGCFSCKTSGKCIYNDMENINYLLEVSDILIIATPVYNLSFPSPLKAIFDRFQPYFFKRFYMNIKPPIKKNKKAVLLLTQGLDDKRAKHIISEQLKMIFTIINADLISSVVWDNIDKNKKIEDIINDIKDAAALFS